MVENFKTIGFRLNSDSSYPIHYLFYQPFKLNADLITSQSTNSTLNDYVSNILYVKNVPPYLEDSHIKSVFNCFGKVDYILFDVKPTAKTFESYLIEQENLKNKIKSYFSSSSEKKYEYREVYVLFNQSQAIEKSMAEQKNDRIVTIGSNLNSGIKKWIDEYKSSYVDARLLQKEIDTFMEEYDTTKESKEKELNETTNEPDEDGWITVTAKTRKATLPFTKRNIEKIKTKEKKKQQQMQLVNFYKFQMKDSKKDYVSQLRKKFEEDKKRIEAMKQTRKFKPF